MLTRGRGGAGSERRPPCSDKTIEVSRVLKVNGRPAVGDAASVDGISRVIRRRGKQLACLALIGAAIGTGAAVLDPGFEAESRVLLQGPRDKNDVLTETELVTSQLVLDRAAQGLDWKVTGAQLLKSVSAEALSGNVFVIRCTANTPKRAQQITDQVAQQYIRFSTSLVSDTLRVAEEGRQQRVSDLRQRVAAAEGRLAQIKDSGSNPVEFDLLNSTIRSANDEITDIDDQGHSSAIEQTLSRSTIKLIEPAVAGSALIPTNALLYVLGGAALFGLGGLLTQLVAASRDRRLVLSEEIGAALGAPLLGDVPVVPAEVTRKYSRGERLRRLVYDERHWDTPRLPVDIGSLETRDRRLLSRLQEFSESGRELSLIVYRDDADSRRAVLRLATAEGRARGACLVCDDADFRQAAEAVVEGDTGIDLTVRAGDELVPAEARTVLRVVLIDALDPSVPDLDAQTGFLVAVSAGTRTAWELLGVTTACQDAGQNVVGVVVVHLAQWTRTPAERVKAPAAATTPVDASESVESV